MSVSSKKLCRRDILESGISPRNLFLIAEDAKLLNEQTPENVQSLVDAIKNDDFPEFRRILVTEKLVSPNTRIANVALLHYVKFEFIHILLECETLDIDDICLCCGKTFLMKKKTPNDIFKMVISDPRVDLEISKRGAPYLKTAAYYAWKYQSRFRLSCFIAHPNQPIFIGLPFSLRYMMAKWRRHIITSNRLAKWFRIPLQIARVISCYGLYLEGYRANVPILHDILDSDGTYSIREILWMGGVVTDLGIKQLEAKRRQSEWINLRNLAREFYKGMSREEMNKYSLQ
jgi:hypothetical protein